MSERSRGARALIPLYVASAVLTLGEGSFNLLVPPYMKTQHVDEVLIGTAVSLYGITSLLSRIPAGALYRSHRAWTLVAAGCALSSLSFVLISQTSNAALLALWVALDGVGFAVATTANMAALIERRPADTDAGVVMGWYTGSLGVGYALAGFVGGPLGDSLGPGPAMFLLALVPLAAGALLARAIHSTRPARVAAEPGPRTPWFRMFRGLPALVWLAFFVTFYINLVSGAVLTFFPIYGLAIGLTLTQIGVLQGIHGAAAAVVRFLSGVFFRWISYERTLPLMVIASGISVALIGSVEVFAVLALAWAGVGLTRGLLRVASAALVMDAAGEVDTSQGAASGVYLAGLDLGKVLGPLVGGVGADTVGLRTTFLVVSAAFPALYFVLAAALRRRRMRSLHSRYGTTA
ncbi:MAG: MFS transporter [Gaiellaceae bacterium]